MRNSKQAEVIEARRKCGAFFRIMLREVRPEHVPDMVHTLWLFGHGGKEVLVPEKGQWLMKMPHGYGLVGEGPVGIRMEPPPGQAAVRLNAPNNGDQAKQNAPAPAKPRVDDHDTEGIVALCQQARQLARPERLARRFSSAGTAALASFLWLKRISSL